MGLDWNARGIQQTCTVICQRPGDERAPVAGIVTTGDGVRSLILEIRNPQSPIHFGMDDGGNWRLAVAERGDNNSPAIFGWVKRQPNGKVPRGTAERVFRP